MPIKLKLISENPHTLDDFEIIEEQTDLKSQSTLYVKGPYIGCNFKNRNGRFYEKNSTSKEVQRYINEMVTPGRAMGELNHPSSSEVNLERASHLVLELVEDGDTYVGKSKVLSTPMGQILRALINDSVRIGMSTRALGSLEVQTEGYNLVKDMHLVAIDAVADPSFPKAFVNGILESKIWIVNDDGTYEEIYEDFQNSLKKIPRKEADSYLRAQIMKFIRSLS